MWIYFVPPIKENIADVLQHLPQEHVQERLAEPIVHFTVSSMKEEIAKRLKST